MPPGSRSGFKTWVRTQQHFYRPTASASYNGEAAVVNGGNTASTRDPLREESQTVEAAWATGLEEHGPVPAGLPGRWAQPRHQGLRPQSPCPAVALGFSGFPSFEKWADAAPGSRFCWENTMKQSTQKNSPLYQPRHGNSQHCMGVYNLNRIVDHDPFPHGRSISKKKIKKNLLL